VDLSRAEWRKSSKSGVNGCVEVAYIEGAVAVRNSRDPVGPVLVFSAAEWGAFLEGAGMGEFD
jgi:Domain of unknown function (DUF397)